jgi:nucleotide-binding universal stress UspA family protein
MIKRILIPLDPSPFSAAALDWALFMAKRQGAELSGLVVLDFPGIRKSIGPVPLGGSFYAERLQASRVKEATKRINAQLADFTGKCETARVRHSESRVQGVAVVMGLRTHFRFGTDERHGDSLEKVLDHSITPIYCIPKDVRPPEGPGRTMTALILFNGSLASGHALQRFAQLARPDRSDVVLLCAGGDREAALGHLENAEAYLRSHAFERIRKEWTDKDLLDVLKSGRQGRIDLIVAGAHSQKHLIKFKLGSVPKHLIEAAATPLLLG